MALISKGDPGITWPPVIDGVAFAVNPSGMNIQPVPIGDHVDTLDGGSRVFQPRPHFDGVADYLDRYEIDIPYRALSGADRVSMERIRVTGIVHKFGVWRMVPAIYTCKAGLQRYYLPRYRQNAAQIFAGIFTAGIQVTTDNFPVLATLNGVDLVVTYADGPALASPGVGGVVVARDADDSGPAKAYTALMLGDVPAAGDVLELWMCVAFEMNLDSPRISFGEGLGRESHTYTFRER